MPEPKIADIQAWSEKVRDDPVAYLQRQATEIILDAMAHTDGLRERVFLKGGTLMGLLYGSPRQTGDLDFSTDIKAADLPGTFFRAELEPQFLTSAIRLGMPDILVNVQSVTHKPRKDGFAEKRFPAFEIKFGYALRGGPEERRLQERQATTVIAADISFNEPIGATQPVRLGMDGSIIMVYSLLDLVAEKFRAYLQQIHRQRSRRQDIYDLHYLLRTYDVDKAALLALIREKCMARDISPNRNSLIEPGLMQNAQKEWNTMKLEIGDLPDFKTCFEPVNAFYRSLPW
ncbi:nucleotidyl transferase AbiEii/AbiGii toxin family protein [Ferrovibrio sp.]|uniref:nucleotidyl transferase AbiEii/AbiGii toxin family protein n=1 Tax=Ferrovibrio sp. TaxID=1917215 RepID=UPI0035AE6838